MIDPGDKKNDNPENKRMTIQKTRLLEEEIMIRICGKMIGNHKETLVHLFTRMGNSFNYYVN